MEPQPLGRSKGTSILIYGVPGAGKTRLIGTGSRTLIVRPPVDHTDSIELPAEVEEVVVDDWTAMLDVFQTLQQGGHRDFDWVWLDSISLMQDVLLDDVMVDMLARQPHRAEVKGGVSIPQLGPDQGEYKINFDRIAKWVRDMVGLAKAGHINFGVTAHPFEWWDPIQEKDVWSPWIQGRNMSPKICGYMNIIAYLQEVRREDKPPQRLLLADADGFVGKDQYHVFPALKSGRHGFIDPSMEDIEGVLKPRSPRRRRPSTKKRGNRARRTRS